MAAPTAIAELILLNDTYALVRGKKVRQIFLYEQGFPVTIGSSDAADIMIATKQRFPECAINALHCQINYDPGYFRFSIVDHGSQYGTWVNNYRLLQQEEVELGKNATIELSDPLCGGVLLRFYPGSKPEHLSSTWILPQDSQIIT